MRLVAPLILALALGGQATGQCPDQWTTGFRSGLGAHVSSFHRLTNGDLVVGGLWSGFDGTAAQNIASWDGSAWSSLGHFPGRDVRGAISSLSNGDVVAAGRSGSSFYTPDNIYRWDGSSWSALGTGVSWRVYALARLPSGDLVAGGDFTDVDGVAAQGLARWDGSSWSELAGGVNGTVHALRVLPNGDLVVGGTFTMAGSVPANRIARWDGATWSAYGTGTDDSIRALEVLPNGNLIAGGSFAAAGGAAATAIAQWDGAAWHPLGGGMQRPSSTLAASVSSLLVTSSGDLFAAGEFDSAGTTSADDIARWDGTAWSSLGPFGGSSSPSFQALAEDATGTLWVGRRVTTTSSTPPDNYAVARWGCPDSIASVTEFGVRCDPEGYSAFLERFPGQPAAFDLSDSTIRMRPASRGYDVDWIPGAPTWFTPASSDLRLGDDVIVYRSIPFSFPYFDRDGAQQTANQVTVSSNGGAHLGRITTSCAMQSAYYGTWRTMCGPSLAILYSDWQPAAGGGAGTVHLDTPNSQAAYVTWSNVQPYGVPAARGTFQIAMFANGEIEYRFRSCSLGPREALTGWIPGSALVPSSLDLSSALPLRTGPDINAQPLRWEVSNSSSSPRPVLGTTIRFTSNASGPIQFATGYAMFVSFTKYDPGIDLSLIGAPGCLLSTGSEMVTHSALTLPNVQGMIGWHVYVQGVMLAPGANPLGVVTSNGLELVLGHW